MKRYKGTHILGSLHRKLKRLLSDQRTRHQVLDGRFLEELDQEIHRVLVNLNRKELNEEDSLKEIIPLSQIGRTHYKVTKTLTRMANDIIVHKDLLDKQAETLSTLINMQSTHETK